MASDDEFEIKSNDDEEDDEETIDQAEKEENESREKELQELEAEKDMPLEMLLAKYNGSPAEVEMNHDEDDEEKVNEEEKGDDSEGLTGESDSEMDFEEEVKDILELKEEPIEALGIKSLLDDSTAGQDGANSKLSDAAALAESFQPKGNTLESTKVNYFILFGIKYD